MLRRRGWPGAAKKSNLAVPAWVCTQCGEPYFEAREVDLIQNALRDLDRESAALTTAGSAASKP